MNYALHFLVLNLNSGSQSEQCGIAPLCVTFNRVFGDKCGKTADTFCDRISVDNQCVKLCSIGLCTDI